MKFKVGDIVTGIKGSRAEYSITNKKMKKGRVLEILPPDDPEDDIKIEVVDHEDSDQIGKVYCVQERYFKLVPPIDISVIEIPLDAIKIRITRTDTLVFEQNQDRTTNILFAYLESSDSYLQYYYVFEKAISTNTNNDYYSYVMTNQFSTTDTILRRFIDGVYPFYNLNRTLYNKQHQTLLNVSESFLDNFPKSSIYPISSNSYIYWRPQTHFIIYSDDKLTIIQKESLPRYVDDAILLDDSIIDNFQMDDEKTNQLSSLATIDEIITYVKEDTPKAVEGNQQSDKKIRVVRR